MEKEKCKHFSFHANVDVCRLVDENDPDLVRSFMAEVTVKCITCGTPFEWIGLECGYRGDKPLVDPSAQELRAPIKPKGLLAMPGIPGFQIKVN